MLKQSYIFPCENICFLLPFLISTHFRATIRCIPFVFLGLRLKFTNLKRKNGHKKSGTLRVEDAAVRKSHALTS